MRAEYPGSRGVLAVRSQAPIPNIPYHYKRKEKETQITETRRRRPMTDLISSMYTKCRSPTIQRLSLRLRPSEETDANLVRLSSSRYDGFRMKWTLTPPFAGQSSKLLPE
jgi:hypothetical protein